MLLLPAASGMQAGTVRALSSTLAGNLFIVGSIANIIVVHEATCRGIVIDCHRRARVGAPVTLATLSITGVYFWLRVLGS
jgi:Na+/H+ antiporter NhaD/arsenite permease-like protein